MINFRWLTERDKRVLDFLCRARYVSTSQLTELFFRYRDDGTENKNPDVVCRRRMKVLEDNNMVKSFYRQAGSDKIYTVHDVKVERIVTLNQIKHSLEINDLFIQIKRYAGYKGHTIHDFYIERPLLNGIIPDIILVYVIKGRAKILFIEYDRGTETLTRIRKKVENYKAYLDKQLYLDEDFQVSKIRPEIWFVCESERRAKNIELLGVKCTTCIEKMLDW